MRRELGALAFGFVMLSACAEPEPSAPTPRAPSPAPAPTPPVARPPRLASGPLVFARAEGLELRMEVDRGNSVLRLANVGSEPATVGTSVDGVLDPRPGWHTRSGSEWVAMAGGGYCGNSHFDSSPLEPGQSRTLQGPESRGEHVLVHPESYLLRLAGERAGVAFVFEAELTYGSPTPLDWSSVDWDPDETPALGSAPTEGDFEGSYIIAGPRETGVLARGQSHRYGVVRREPGRLYVVVSSRCRSLNPRCTPDIGLSLGDERSPVPPLTPRGRRKSRPPDGSSRWTVQRYDVELAGPDVYGSGRTLALDGRGPAAEYMIEILWQPTPDEDWRLRFPMAY